MTDGPLAEAAPALAGLPLDRPRVMGIVNVTPDSFSDGGRFAETEAAITHARALMAEGADILDIGGESTRPGAVDVPEDEEAARVLPVIRALRDEGAPISIDTRKPKVMRVAVEAGAVIINDVSALAHAPESAAVAAELGVPVILGHMRGTPATLKAHAEYRDVVAEVRAELAARRDTAIAAGIEHGNVLLDPGFGFAKKPQHNAALLARLDAIVALGHPVVAGPSRKLFASRHKGTAGGRVGASIAAALLAVEGGAKVLRVHDVAETLQALAVWRSVREAR